MQATMGRDEELGPLLPRSSDDSNKYQRRSYLKTIVLGTIGVAAIALFSFKTEEKVGAEELNSSTSLSLSFDSGYGQPQSIQNGFYSGISAIVEPYRVATLTLSGLKSSSPRLKWTIAEEVMQPSDLYFDSQSFAQQLDRSEIEPLREPTFDMEGASHYETTTNVVTHKFGAIAGKRIHVSVTSETGESYTITVHGKYIRREMRSLTDADRELYLNAIHTVYSTDTKTGQSLYGEHFRGHDYYGYNHLGSKQYHHRWHNSPSFFPAHAAVCEVFEVSMQLVEPSVSLNYWDFLIDSVKYADATEFKNGWGESEVWSEKWFGPMAFSDDGLFETAEISNTDKRISGRWADSRMCLNASSALGMNDEIGVAHNSYGWSRDVNNNNPSKSVTRSFEICGLKTTSMDIPGCYELLGAFSQTTMSDLHDATEFNLHLSFHTKFGGAWECGYNFRHLEHKLLAAGKSYPKVVSSIAESLMSLWHNAYFDGNLVAPSHCSLATPFEECQLSCSDLEEAIEAVDPTIGYKGNWYGTDVDGSTLTSRQWDDFFRSKVLKHLNTKMTQGVHVEVDEDTGRYFFTDVDKTDYVIQDELKAALVVSVCRPGKIGEFMGPLGSGQDPIFHPLHTNLERIWQYARIAKGVPTDWEDEAGWDDDASTTSYEFTPIGWKLDDPQDPFNYILGMQRSPEGTLYTNRELNAIFNPTNERLTYIYDHASFEICTGADDDTR